MKTINTSILFFFFFLSFSINIQSQNKVIDSLKNELQNHKEKDTVRVNLLNNLAYKNLRKDITKAIEYLEESEAIAKEIDFTKGRAESIRYRGMTHAIKSNYEQGFESYNEALQLYKTINFKHGISNSYLSIAILFYRKRDYKKSIAYYLEFVKINEERHKYENVITGLFYIGRANTEIGNYTDAITYYKKTIKISKGINNEKRIPASLSGIGNVYNHQGNYPVAIEYYKKLMDIGKKNENNKAICDALLNIGNVYIKLQNYDKAIVFHKKALKISKEIDEQNLSSIYNNLGEAYKGKKNYKLARDFFEKAIKKFKEENNKANEAISLNNIADIYLELKDYKDAYQYFDKAKKICLEVDNKRGLCSSYLGIAKVYSNQKIYKLALINALKSKELSTKLELLDFQRDGQRLLSKIYENTGDYKKALASHQQFKILNDSLFNKKNIENITQLEYEYKYKQALDSASIRELKLTKTVISTNKDLEKSKQNYLWAIIAVLLVSILLGAIISYLKFRNVKSKTQNIVIEQRLLRSQMTPHFIFNSLSVLQGMILNKEEKKSVSYLSKFSKLLRITLENSRHKTVSLCQELTAIENYLTLQNLENKSYQHTVLVDDTIDRSLFKIPPMLIQPFIENAIEHAFGNQNENRKIDIHLSYLDKKLSCTITDNGTGIDSKKENKRKDKKSLATTITSERLKILSKYFKIEGSIRIEDRQKYNEQGTIVTLVIPYKINVA